MTSLELIEILNDYIAFIFTPFNSLFAENDMNMIKYNICI